MAEIVISPCVWICCLQPLDAFLSGPSLLIPVSVAENPCEVVGRVWWDTKIIVPPSVGVCGFQDLHTFRVGYSSWKIQCHNDVQFLNYIITNKSWSSSFWEPCWLARMKHYCPTIWLAVHVETNAWVSLVVSPAEEVISPCVFGRFSCLPDSITIVSTWYASGAPFEVLRPWRQWFPNWNEFVLSVYLFFMNSRNFFLQYRLRIHDLLCELTRYHDLYLRVR